MRLKFAIIMCCLVTFSFPQAASTSNVDQVIADVRELLCFYKSEAERITSSGTPSQLSRLNLEVQIWQDELYAIYGADTVKLAAQVVTDEVRELGDAACAL